ncbi:MAG: LysR substrate-binding domain-containing protein, partial [Verrucomicrobiota bacterium]
KLKTLEELWRQDRIEEPLICLPPEETIARNFQAGLAKLGVDWPVSIQVNSLELIESYVANGFGLGVSVAFPQPTSQRPVRVLPLHGFKAVGVAAFWQGKLNPITKALLDEVHLRAQFLRNQEQSAGK